MSSTTAPTTEFLDAHHHFFDTRNNSFHTFLASLVPNEAYMPQDYNRDLVDPLSQAGVKLVGSVHVESITDDGYEETKWVESLPSSTVLAIVASCDLTKPTVDEDLARLKQASPKVRGVRWILDCVGKFDGGKTATHVATKRHDGIDYLRGSNGGYDGLVVPQFETGFKHLEKHGLSFDLQCAPSQLMAAAEFMAKYPKINVCIDHLGKPRTLLGPDVIEEGNDEVTVPDQHELAVWRTGIKAMAALPNVCIKISMLGYCIPGWIRNDQRISLMRKLVREIVSLFGPKRCMVASNFHKSASLSDSDGFSDVGPDPVQFLNLLSEFLKDYSEEDRSRIFCGTAREFYRI